MRIIAIFILLISIFTACSNATNSNLPLPSESYVEHPPIPPDPFPIEMKCNYEIEHLLDNAEVNFELLFNTNEELDEFVIIKYSVYKNSTDNMSQSELYSKEIFNERIAIRNQKVINEKIVLEEYGRYVILFNADYSPYGQQCQYIFDFNKNRIKEIVM